MAGKMKGKEQEGSHEQQYRLMVQLLRQVACGEAQGAGEQREEVERHPVFGVVYLQEEVQKPVREKIGEQKDGKYDLWLKKSFLRDHLEHGVPRNEQGQQNQQVICALDSGLCQRFGKTFNGNAEKPCGAASVKQPFFFCNE